MRFINNKRLIPQRQALSLRENFSYLLVGGLGGLGRAVSEWMVHNRARYLIFLSRTAGTNPEDEEFCRELETMNSRRDYRNRKTSQKAFYNSSAGFRDENFSNMTIDQWNEASLPKTKGTWNLHNKTVSANIDLDFFVIFSSLSGVVRQPGQANYASTNTFLDAFVQYRNSLSLAASVIGIGAVQGIGYVSKNQGLMQKMEDSGFYTVGVKTAGTESSRSIQNNFVLGLRSSLPLTSPTNLAVWKRDCRMTIYHNDSSAAASSTAITADTSATLQKFISAAKAKPSKLKSNEATTLFATEIERKLFQLLLKPDDHLNTDMSLVDLGMDSLVGIEMRSWWRGVFGFDIRVQGTRANGIIINVHPTPPL
ncbi:KR-domain-containing protein [Periconia macrospinosa]|uniref:KR-domain-containing protein n=1 Tax=Periconia macrospinosa TaxID=97972 RepID=A0A2V1DY62_9PLEO|nr:KR-domain-containing protein [Periconia macrospinosa]